MPTLTAYACSDWEIVLTLERSVAQSWFIMLRLLLFGTALASLAGCSLCPCAKKETTVPGQGVQITKLPDRLRIEINGQSFTEYLFKDVPRPYFYPILGPDNLAMTRNWPMKDTPDEEHDHPHHRSLWFTHGSVNGKDFWSEEKSFGKVVHEAFAEVKAGKNFGLIKSKDNWIAADGTIVCTDDRTFRIYNPGTANERVFDFEVTLHASHGALTLGDTKEGTMAI